MSLRPLYLPVGDEAAFACLHPASGTPRDTAVLLCPPFGWEDVCSYRSRRDWAEELAAAGHPALRLDLPGSGDGSGAPRDPGRLEAWTSAVDVAVRRLRAESGAARVAVIGIGLGGLVALRAVAAGTRVDDLVLWAVPARGRALVRELRAFARLEDVQLAEAGSPWAERTDGALFAAGFLLAPETAEALERFDASALALPAGMRALLLDRDGVRVDPRLQGHLAAAGLEVTVAPGPGFGAMTAKPHDARAPHAVFERVAGWLADAPARPAAQASDAPPAPAALDAIELTAGGMRIRERPLTIEVPAGRLLGILAEPAEAAARTGVGAVLLNAGAIRRIGPNRMWVEAARRWAARGVPTLRLDLEGIGDADGDGERFSDVGEMYVPELVDQALAAVDVLEGRGVARRFLLAGLCSGAYWAFHAAVRDERVAAALLLNPRTLVWDPRAETARRARAVGKLRRGYVWRRVLRGERSLAEAAGIGRAVAARAVTRPVEIVRRATARQGGNEIDRAFDTLDASGTRTVLAFTGDEPLHAELEREGRLARLERSPHLALEVLSGPPETHTLRPPALQARAHALLDRELDALLTG